ncbi:hypothetical protein [Sulfurisphaera ohwakuensis]|uniref:hypothetical protein n=1 Tax=Sulfurisphaera ohwakuensis TaxID=69656 RepID=UPI0036F2E845
MIQSKDLRSKMEKIFQINNVDINTIHDKLLNELQNSGFEIHRDEPRDNGFKIFVRRGEEHGEVEVFSDWNVIKLITHGRLEWELMSIAESLINQVQVSPGATTSAIQTSSAMTIQPTPSPQIQNPPSLQQQLPRPMQYNMPQQFTPQQPLQPSMYHSSPQFPITQGGLSEQMQLVNILIQNGYQIEVNTVNGQIFFVRARKGNYVIDIEGRPQP